MRFNRRSGCPLIVIHGYVESPVKSHKIAQKTDLFDRSQRNPVDVGG